MINANRLTLGRAARRRWGLYTGFALALVAGGCLQDGATTGPSTSSARLALNASVATSTEGAAAVSALGVEVRYLRSTGEPGLLLQQIVPLAGVAPGGTVRKPVQVDLGACLADPLHVPEGNACAVNVRLTLLSGSATLDVVTIGPLTLRPGETAEPAEVTLHTVGTLAVSPHQLASLFPDQEVQLTATLTDATGAAVEGREIGWTTSAPAVATVDANGKVRAVAPGTALITASGGDRTATVRVNVVPRATIVLDHDEISFDGRRTAEPPASQVVRIVNGTTGTLDSLVVGAINYGSAVTPWLSATLSAATAPTTLVLRPSRTDLPAGTYVATVELRSPAASNSGITVRVTYTVIDVPLITVGKSRIDFTGRYYPQAGELETTVTSAGPLGGLQASVQYGAYADGWLTAALSSDSTPATLQVGVSGYMFPGFYDARVRITAPGAANIAEVRVFWTVPQDGFYFSLVPSNECYFTPDPSAADTVYVDAFLSDSAAGTLSGMPFIMRALDPGLTLINATGSTYGSSVVAVRTPGFLGNVRLEGVLGTPPHAPGTLRDTLNINFQNSDPYCSGEGYSRVPYVLPDAPVLRNAPAGPPWLPSAGQTTTSRAGRAASVDTRPTRSAIRSRFTPEQP